MAAVYINPTGAREIYPAKSTTFVMRCGETITQWASVAADADGNVFLCDDGHPNFFGVALKGGVVGEKISVMREGYIQAQLALQSNDAAVDHTGQAIWSNIASTTALHGMFDNAEPTGTTADELADDALNSFVGKAITQWSVNGVINLIHIMG